MVLRGEVVAVKDGVYLGLRVLGGAMAAIWSFEGQTRCRVICP